MIMARKNKIEKGSGNVFADLGLANADELENKAQLAHRIGEIIRGRPPDPGEAAEVLGSSG